MRNIALTLQYLGTAYHGWQVQKTGSADGQTLQGLPYSQMNHYVNKITSCYGAYQRIYAGN